MAAMCITVACLQPRVITSELACTNNALGIAVSPVVTLCSLVGTAGMRSPCTFAVSYVALTASLNVTSQTALSIVLWQLEVICRRAYCHIGCSECGSDDQEQRKTLLYCVNAATAVQSDDASMHLRAAVTKVDLHQKHSHVSHTKFKHNALLKR
eukprot:9607-Heterococcus_DN1.PRE.2